MIFVVIVVVLVAIGAVVFVATSKKKGDGPSTTATARPSTAEPPARAEAAAPARPTPSVPPSARERAREGKAPIARAEVAPPAPIAAEPADDPVVDDEPDLSRFGGAAAPRVEPSVTAGSAPAASTPSFRYPMEAPIDDLVASEPSQVETADNALDAFAEAVSAPAESAPAESAPLVEPEIIEPDVAEVVALVAQEPPPETEAVVEPEPLPAFDLDRVLVAPMFGSWSDDESDEGTELEGTGATVTRLEPRLEPEEAPLAEIVADLIDAADPEVAEVMARLIDSSDPDLVARLVDADDLEVAEVVAKLLDAADDEVRSMVVDLADAPDRRQVAEVLKLVDAAYAGDDAMLSPDIADKLEELDIESDLELTSRPAEMAQFARLENKDQLRVIIRVLCGLVAREDLPRSPRMPAVPASSAENRRWPLSRARWPVPPPDDEDIIKRAPLPARRADTKAS